MTKRIIERYALPGPKPRARVTTAVIQERVERLARWKAICARTREGLAQIDAIIGVKRKARTVV